MYRQFCRACQKEAVIFQLAKGRVEYLCARRCEDNGADITADDCFQAMSSCPPSQCPHCQTTATQFVVSGCGFWWRCATRGCRGHKWLARKIVEEESLVANQLAGGE